MKYILTADLHFQYHTPICRMDDFIATQIKKMEWLKSLAEEKDAVILCSGDVTHRAREDKQNEILNLLFDHLPVMLGVVGNHDILSHSMDNLHKSAIGVLNKAGIYTILYPNEPFTMDKDLIYGFNWGDDMQRPMETGSNATIAVWHKMVFAPNDDLKKYASGVDSSTLLDLFPSYDLILTGDNHKTFTIEKDGRFLVNPGSFMRITAAQKDFNPSVFLYDSVEHTLEQIFVPIEDGVISDDHIGEKSNIDFNAYIERIKNKEDISIDFYENMNHYIRNESVDKVIEEKILSFMEV